MTPFKSAICLVCQNEIKQIKSKCSSPEPNFNFEYHTPILKIELEMRNEHDSRVKDAKVEDMD